MNDVPSILRDGYSLRDYAEADRGALSGFGAQVIGLVAGERRRSPASGAVSADAGSEVFQKPAAERHQNRLDRLIHRIPDELNVALDAGVAVSFAQVDLEYPGALSTHKK